MSDEYEIYYDDRLVDAFDSNSNNEAKIKAKFKLEVVKVGSHK